MMILIRSAMTSACAAGILLHGVTRPVVATTPPVSVTPGVWVERGAEIERARLRTRIATLEQELLDLALAKQAMDERLSLAHERLMVEEQHRVERETLRVALAAAQTEVAKARDELVARENAALTTEESFRVELDRAGQEAGVLRGALGTLETRLTDRVGEASALQAKIEGLIRLQESENVLRGELEQALNARAGVEQELQGALDRTRSMMSEMEARILQKEQESLELREMWEQAQKEGGEATKALDTLQEEVFAKGAERLKMEADLRELRGVELSLRSELENMALATRLQQERIDQLVLAERALALENEELLRKAMELDGALAARAEELRGAREQYAAELARITDESERARAGMESQATALREEMALLKQSLDKSGLQTNEAMSAMQLQLQEKEQAMEALEKAREEQRVSLQETIAALEQKLEEQEAAHLVRVAALEEERSALKAGAAEFEAAAQRRQVAMQQELQASFEERSAELTENHALQVARLMQQIARLSQESEQTRLEYEVGRQALMATFQEQAAGAVVGARASLEEEQKVLALAFESERAALSEKLAASQEALRQAQEQSMLVLAGEQQKMNEEREALRAEFNQRLADEKEEAAKLSLVEKEALALQISELNKSMAEAQDESRKLALQREQLALQLQEKEAGLVAQQKLIEEETRRANALRLAREELEGRLAELEKNLGDERKRREELETMAQRYETLRGELESLSSTLMQASQKQDLDQENLAAVTAERNRLRDRIADYEDRVREQSGEITRQKQLLDDIRETMRLVEEGAARLEVSPEPAPPLWLERVTEMNVKLSDRERQLQEMAAANSRLEIQLVEAQALLARERQRRPDEAMPIPTNEAEVLRRELDATKQELIRLQESRAAAEALMRDMERGLAAAPSEPPPGSPTEDIKRRDTEIERLRTEMRSLRERLDKQNELALTSRLNEQEAELARVRADNLRLREINEARMAELERARDGIAPFVAAAPIDKEEADKLMAEAAVAEANSQFMLAAQLLQRLLLAAPDDVDLLNRLSLALYQTGDIPSAENQLAKALALRPDHPPSLGTQALIEWYKGNLDEAAELIARALRGAPLNPVLHNYTGVIANARREIPAAIKALEQAVQIDPEYAEARFNLAVLLANHDKSRIVEARRHYQEAIRLGAERETKLEKLLAD